MKQALSIAGSDSGGGAGIQADLKTMHAHGVFGMSVVTAVTAQNTVEVARAMELPVEMIDAQLEAVFDDFDIAAVKTGMLSSSDIIQTVSAALIQRQVGTLVVDPVMISKSGYRLLKDEAIETIKQKLLPLALVVTPNLHEAELLSGLTIDSAATMTEAARKIAGYGCRNVIIKGGHASFNPATDILYDGDTIHTFKAVFIDKKSVHGTGCTFSAAITARLALGESVPEAVGHAKAYITEAIRRSPQIGRGHGPANHFYFIGPDDFRMKD